MSAAPRARPSVVIVRRQGDPFEAESYEGASPPGEAEHLAVLDKLFYDSTVDLGGVVRVGRQTYVCTRAGWRRIEGDPPG